MTVFQTSRRVEFRDTDAAGIAHFTALIGYMEESEHEFLRHVGLSVIGRDDEGEISWPRVSVEAKFSAAVKFEEEVQIEVGVARMGQKSVTYAFVLNARGQQVATGTIAAVCCRIAPQQPPQSIVIPDWIRARLEPWVRK